MEEKSSQIYISITGLQPKSFWATIRFWILAVPSFNQAKKAKGNLFCAVKQVQGYQCTLTAWESRDRMLEFLRSGVHLKAMKSFPKIATGKTHGYHAYQIPSWEEAFAILQSNGRLYQ